MREFEDGVAIKVCGLTNTADALACAQMGVEMLGLNFSTRSPRSISPAIAGAIIASVRAQFPQTRFVGVFLDQDVDYVRKIAADLALDAIQLHGEETPVYLRELGAAFVIKALPGGSGRLSAAAADYECDAILLDSGDLGSPGGTGKTFAWSIAAALRGQVRRLILAGGLTSSNVAEAIRTVRPFAVDVCSGVEASPRRKDHARVRALVAAVRATSAMETAK
jgi:phosphoribosylanthranilate isomerase